MTADETVLERVFSSLEIKFRGQKVVKIKIIKRTATEEIAEETAAAEDRQKTARRKAIEPVRLWIDDLGRTHERERLSGKELLSRKPCE